MSISNVKVPVAIGKLNKFDLSCTNVTTNDFFKLKPVYTRELMPRQKIDINMSLFSRLAPMFKPMYGSAKFVTRCFFVPYRTLVLGFNEFITDTKYNGNFIYIPYIKNSTIVYMFLTNSQYATSSAQLGADFAIKTGINVYEYRKFTAKGKHAFDVLQNLGYQINFSMLEGDDVSMSALPFLAYRKVIYDWYVNRQYNDLNLNPESYAVETSLPVGVLIATFDKGLYAQYPKDYFTSAWDNPVSPNNQSVSSSAIQIVDPTYAKDRESSDSVIVPRETDNHYGTPVLEDPDNEFTNFTQYLDTALHKVTDYVKRHQLAGTLAMDRFYTRYGIHLKDAVLNRSTYLGKSISPITIADVMNMSSSDEATLGEYAAKGVSSSNGHFHFESEEFGQLIVMNVIIPDVSYVQGRDRMLQHIDKLSFATPEFDMLGVQALRKDEILAGFDNINLKPHSSYQADGVFGFTSRYSEYKCPVNRVTGNFGLKLFSSTSDENRWHFARLFGSEYNPVHDLSFCTGTQQQYDRIFSDTNDDYDHFISVFRFNITSHMPLAHMYDDYEWSEMDKPRVDVPLNGTTLD